MPVIKSDVESWLTDHRQQIRWRQSAKFVEYPGVAVLYFTIFADLHKLVNIFYPMLLTHFPISKAMCFITPTNGPASRTFDSAVRGRVGPRSGLDIQGEENPPVPIPIRTPARPGHSLETNRYLLSLFCSNAWRLAYSHRIASSCLISECFILLDCVYPSTIFILRGAFEK